MADWLKIKAEYITTNISYRRLADKHGVSFSRLQEIARKEKWVEERGHYREKAMTKITERAGNKAADRYARLMSVADKLLAKIEASVEQMDADGVTMDKSGIRALAGAIRDIKDIQALKSELDLQEQRARIAKLERESRDETDEDRTIIVRFDDGLEQYAD